METNGIAVDTLDEIMAGLARVRRWMLDHPEIEFCSVNVHRLSVSAQIGRSGGNVAERFAAAVRALAAGAPKGAVTKDISDSLYSVVRDFDGFKLDIYTGRDQVCEAKVVGTETVRVPDPDAPMVTIQRDLIEWECKPLLLIEAHADTDPGEHYAEQAAESGVRT